jgi:hypothetical protein
MRCERNNSNVESLTESLIHSRGDFSGFAYSCRDKVLTVYADKLAVRPVYYWYSEIYGLFVFSFNLSILARGLAQFLTADLDGVLEEVSMGTSLDGRTVFRDIHRARPGETITVSQDAGQLIRDFYWTWRKFDSQSQNTDEILLEISKSFHSAVESRLGSGDQVAFLSGGLDSRIVSSCVASLCDKRLNTFSFGAKYSQDLNFARSFSSQIDSTHFEREMDELSFPNFSVLLSDELKKRGLFDFQDINYSWSGDGGSVGLGYVYLGEDLQELSAQGALKDACELLARNNGWNIPTRFIKKGVLNKFDLIENIYRLVESYQASQDADKLYLFLLNNDQSRHLDHHFETIQDHMIELHLPFFDGRFVSSLMKIPFERGLYHRFYHDLLPFFPKDVMSVPWQTYPGHISCPIKIKENLNPQWGGRGGKRISAYEFTRIYTHSLRQIRFYRRFLNVAAVTAGYFLHLLRLKDYTYLGKMLERSLRKFRSD